MSLCKLGLHVHLQTINSEERISHQGVIIMPFLTSKGVGLTPL